MVDSTGNTEFHPNRLAPFFDGFLDLMAILIKPVSTLLFPITGYPSTDESKMALLSKFHFSSGQARLVAPSSRAAFMAICSSCLIFASSSDDMFNLCFVGYLTCYRLDSRIFLELFLSSSGPCLFDVFKIITLSNNIIQSMRAFRSRVYPGVVVIIVSLETGVYYG